LSDSESEEEDLHFQFDGGFQLTQPNEKGETDGNQI
jgi:hypothetical protein